MSCPDVNDFINFCENDEEAELNFYYYCRHLFFNLDKEDIFFEKLYETYCKKRNIEKTNEHYAICKFVMVEYFMDDCIRMDNRIKNKLFPTGTY